jgi:transcriptional regulator with XRE-family HTH domain
MDEMVCEAEGVSEAFIATDDKEAWDRLAEQVRARRTQLRLSQGQAREFAGRSNAFWWKLESGEAGPRIYLSSAAAIERGLRWREDSVKGILLHGWEPTPIETSPDLEHVLETVESLRDEVADLKKVITQLGSEDYIVGLIVDALRNSRS